MMDLLSGIMVLFAMILGYIIGSGNCKQPLTNEALEERIDELEKQIKYYKDLCLWHVEEKEKLKQERYIK